MGKSSGTGSTGSPTRSCPSRTSKQPNGKPRQRSTRRATSRCLTSIWSVLVGDIARQGEVGCLRGGPGAQRRSSPQGRGLVRVRCLAELADLAHVGDVRRDDGLGCVSGGSALEGPVQQEPRRSLPRPQRGSRREDQHDQHDRHPSSTTPTDHAVLDSTEPSAFPSVRRPTHHRGC